MKKRIIYFGIPVILALIGLTHFCLAITISATGTWSDVVDSADLPAGAGSDLRSNHESATDQVSIDITGTIGNWQVYVKRADTNWHASLSLFIKRNTDGFGIGSIANGSAYQLLSDTDQNFFNGNDARTNIKIQLKLSGASILVPPDVYTTTVYYTVSDI